MWLRDNSPIINFRVEGKAAEGHSVTVRFETGINSKELVMDTPGGIVVRPPKRIYDPTFWPVQHFVHLQDFDNGRGIAILQPLPGAISYQPDGQLELVATRNATREKIFGLIGIPGNPASGHERGSYAFEYGLLFTENGDWQENKVHLLARNIESSPWSNPRDRALRGFADFIVTTDSRDVWVTAIKPASRGEGVILRLNAHVLPKSPVLVAAHQFRVTGAFLCDARERDLSPLEVQDGKVRVTMTGTVATIRLFEILFDK
jgi:alpha-mannosidase